MPRPRQRFIAAQAEILDEIFGLTVGENETRRTFEQLARDTYDALEKGQVGCLGPFSPYPSAFNFAVYDRGAGAAAPADLRDRWRAWQAEYLRLVKRQPALELRDAIHDISESHDRASWPTVGLERAIYAWVNAGDPTALPFDDRDDIATPNFYNRLRELHRMLQGWLFQDPETERVAFVPDKVLARP